jgi:hypothetical protein
MLIAIEHYKKILIIPDVVDFVRNRDDGQCTRGRLNLERFSKRKGLAYIRG